MRLAPTQIACSPTLRRGAPSGAAELPSSASRGVPKAQAMMEGFQREGWEVAQGDGVRWCGRLVLGGLKKTESSPSDDPWGGRVFHRGFREFYPIKEVIGLVATPFSRLI